MTMVPGLARRTLGDRSTAAPRGGEADLGGLDPEVGQGQVSTGFFFAAMIPLNDG